ncbi:winged helix-turn-helix transcriptional regulator [Kocuria coralli]|uniref:Glycerol operon regulatory protein n=1 Tax=Kocuria coralli TaxID=1461025 RepID=A0A5J5KZU0_9MICC|nr:IclR family transcriptional regulator C-terminal domain-containing protein [Kocuria coralli]KAA9395209.1 winged helix-turn-helix transcriptional regulator [Kocuria coralli]
MTAEHPARPEEPEALRSGGHYVQSLARGLAVIAAFDAENPSMTLSDVARRTGLTRATARRFLLTLEELGYVRSDGRRFELTAKVLQLGYSYLSALSLPELAAPHLRALSATVQESCSIAVLEGPDIVYVARVQMRHIMNVAISVGTRFPAHATSMGRVLLAGLPDDEVLALCGEQLRTPLSARTVSTPDQLISRLREVREQGYAVVDQELEPGLRSVAVPLEDAAGRTVAAVNVSMRVGASPAAEDPGRLILPHLRACASAIHEDLVRAPSGSGPAR